MAFKCVDDRSLHINLSKRIVPTVLLTKILMLL